MVYLVYTDYFMHIFDVSSEICFYKNKISILVCTMSCELHNSLTGNEMHSIRGNRPLNEVPVDHEL